MFNSIFNQSVEVEITKTIEVSTTRQINRDTSVTETIRTTSRIQSQNDLDVARMLIRQADRPMGLTDLLNSINARSAKRR